MRLADTPETRAIYRAVTSTDYAPDLLTHLETSWPKMHKAITDIVARVRTEIEAEETLPARRKTEKERIEKVSMREAARTTERVKAEDAREPTPRPARERPPRPDPTSSPEG